MELVKGHLNDEAFMYHILEHFIYLCFIWCDMLLRFKRNNEFTTSKCFELIKGRNNTVIKIDFLEVARRLLKVCKDLQLDVVTRIARNGYRTLIRLSSKDLVKCTELFKVILSTYISDDIDLNEVDCSNGIGDKYPFS